MHPIIPSRCYWTMTIIAQPHCWFSGGSCDFSLFSQLLQFMFFFSWKPAATWSAAVSASAWIGWDGWSTAFSHFQNLMMCETQSFPHLTHCHEAAAHCHCHQPEHCPPATCWRNQQSHRHSACWLDFMFFFCFLLPGDKPTNVRCIFRASLHTDLNLSKLHFTSVSHPLSAIGSAVTPFSLLALFSPAFLDFFAKRLFYPWAPLAVSCLRRSIINPASDCVSILVAHSSALECVSATPSFTLTAVIAILHFIWQFTPFVSNRLVERRWYSEVWRPAAANNVLLSHWPVCFLAFYPLVYKEILAKVNRLMIRPHPQLGSSRVMEHLSQTIGSRRTYFASCTHSADDPTRSLRLYRGD